MLTGSSVVPPPRPAGGLFFALLAVLGAISLAPLFVTDVPPLADYPNHLARIHILEHIADDPDLSRFYEVQWRVIPNLAMDVFAIALPWIASPYLKGKLFIALLLALTVGATCLLHYALHRRLSLWPLLSFLVLYNRLLLWGMLNYLFGVALLLLAVATWIGLRERSAPIRITASSALALGVFFGHLFPFGLFAIAVAAYEMQRQVERSERRFRALAADTLVGVAPFVLPIVLFLAFSPTAGYSGHIEFGDLARKFVKAPFAIVRNYDLGLDLVTLFGFGGFLVAGIVRGWLGLERRMIFVLVAFAIVHLVMPRQLMSSPGADIRTTLPLTLVLIASLDWKSPRRGLGAICVVVWLSLFGLRTAVLAQQWAWADREVLSEYRAAFSHLPRATRVNNLFLITGPTWFTNPPHAHFTALAVIERSVFAPVLWTHPARQPVAFRGRYAEIADRAPAAEVHYPDRDAPLVPDARDPRNPFFAPRFRYYDFFLVANVAGLGGPVPDFLEEVYVGDFLTLYAVRRAAGR